MADFIVNTTSGFNFEFDKQEFDDFDIVKNNDGSFHIIFNNKSYNISIIEKDINSKKYSVQVNGKEVDLKIKDSLDQMLDKMGFSNNKKHKSGEIKSPMPGMVLHIDVKEGQEIEKGDTLLVLEAMKMENLIKAHANGVIKSIKVNQGEAVSKNQVLLEIG
ncbi:MAG TPA: acetyl-CoA carboxylase biotin carboxyl carrier protein subunit [Bacteroidetes bacterium]|nr:acetyl-CoA carboxylase biotin carboxyl carrier protein subunit [Bacteroidota bacterium]